MHADQPQPARLDRGLLRRLRLGAVRRHPGAGVAGVEPRRRGRPTPTAPTRTDLVAERRRGPGARLRRPRPGAAQRPDRDLDDPGGRRRVGAGSTTGSTAALLDRRRRRLWLLALLLVPALRRVLLRRRRRHAATVPKATAVAAVDRPRRATRDVVVDHRVGHAPAQDAHAAWDELIDTMIDFRVPVDPTETPRITAERLVRDADLRDLAARSRRRCSAGPRSGPGTPASRCTAAS